jgi:hypothetical protein
MHYLLIAGMEKESYHRTIPGCSLFLMSLSFRKKIFFWISGSASSVFGDPGILHHRTFPA